MPLLASTLPTSCCAPHTQAMTDGPDRAAPPTSSDWASSIDSWSENVARSRRWIARLEQAAPASEAEFEIVRDLGVTVEELSVAEAELRAQNEQLERAHLDLE